MVTTAMIGITKESRQLPTLLLSITNGLILTVTMALINYTSVKQSSGMTMARKLISLETDIVDLGAGNGRTLHLRLLEYVGIMVQEAFPMEFRHCVGKISA